MSNTPCSALISDSDANGRQVVRCKHGHSVTAACRGIGTDLIAPVCTDERRFFDEERSIVWGHCWRGE
jgi:hypothetical protein